VLASNKIRITDSKFNMILKLKSDYFVESAKYVLQKRYLCRIHKSYNNNYIFKLAFKKNWIWTVWNVPDNCAFVWPFSCVLERECFWEFRRSLLEIEFSKWPDKIRSPKDYSQWRKRFCCRCYVSWRKFEVISVLVFLCQALQHNDTDFSLSGTIQSFFFRLFQYFF
jgi:hypothetical protein